MKADSESFDTSTISNVRSSFQHQYQRFINDIRNTNASKNVLSFLTSSSSSSSPLLSSSSLSSFSTLSQPLQSNTELAAIDMIALYSSIENDYGYCERSIAIMLALIELNLLSPPPSSSSSSSSSLLKLFEDYWESEYPRITDINNGNGSFNGWITAGKPKDGWKIYDNDYDDNNNKILNESIKSIDDIFSLSLLLDKNKNDNSNTNTTNSDINNNANTNSKTNDDYVETYVYSRLHGYRIKVTNEDTGIIIIIISYYYYYYYY